MNDKIQSHKECPDLGYMYDFELGRYDESRPICYNPGVKSLDLFEIIPLCGRGNPVKLDDIKYCATCKFYPKQDEQETPGQKALLS